MFTVEKQLWIGQLFNVTKKEVLCEFRKFHNVLWIKPFDSKPLNTAFTEIRIWWFNTAV